MARPGGLSDARGGEVESAIHFALAAGYRSFDTASFYANEAGVGRALRASGIPREEIFLTTKVWNDDQRARRVRDSFDESLDRLGTDYLDLYLIHWPVPGCFRETWDELQRLYQSGRSRAIGVSNFLIPHLDVLLVKKYARTAAQVVLRWNVQQGVVTIPKSTRLARIRENAAIFDFELDPEDMAALDALDQRKRFGPDPANFDF